MGNNYPISNNICRLNFYKIIKHGFLLITIIFAVNCSPKIQYHSEKSGSSDKAMVVTTHPLASDIGLKIIKDGGNAVDAAVAIQFALAVVYPRAGNLGGGGFMVYRDKDGNNSTLDFREKAPLKASKDMYLDEKGIPISEMSTLGHLAVGVPGSVSGMFTAHQKYGKLPWHKLLAPAIKLAKKGFPLSQLEAGKLNYYKDVFIEINGKDWPFVKDEKWKLNDILVQKNLSKTLKLIQKKGAEGFYEGVVADMIVRDMQNNNGILSLKDLKAYSSKWRASIEYDYKGYKVISMAPPSSGGMTLAQILGMLKATDVGKMGFDNPLTKHLMIEAERRAYADRAEYLGDSDFVDIDIKKLIDDDYLFRKIADFNPRKTTPSDKLKSKIRVLPESFETTHYSVVDNEGNAVSITTTLNMNFGSKVFVKEAGFFLNNEMDDFSAKPGYPNVYGLVGAEANAIAPSKRMLSSMTPTIVEKNNNLFMVLGTPGGSTIITSVLQVFLNVVEFNMNIDEAVQAKRFHHQWLPDVVLYEEGAFNETISKHLTKKGHIFKLRKSIGLVEAILVDENGKLHGAADSRGDDDVSGW